MKKWIFAILGTITITIAIVLISVDQHVRYLLLNPPPDNNVLFWTQAQRDAGFRSIDKLPIVEKAAIKAGAKPSELPNGEPLDLPSDLIDNYFANHGAAALIVLHKDKIRLERYGLGFDKNGKWTSFSVAKSLTSTLVGAAIKDGFIKGLDDKVTDYVTSMQGSAYDEVSIQQLLTMTSGVKWNEDYDDPNSDVAKFNFQQSQDNIDVTASYMRNLPRAHEPGKVWHYSTGETNLTGLVVQHAVGKPLSEYLSEKIWSKIGMEQDASWVLGPSGNEIAGCCIQASTRDFLRFGQFILNGARINDQSILPADYLSLATSERTNTNDPSSGYGFQWWISEDGSFQARGIFGQGILIDPARELVVAINGNWPAALGDQDVVAKQGLFKAIQTSLDLEQELASQAPPAPEQ